MANLLNEIANFIEALIIMAGYPGIFALMFLENIFPPMPSDPIMPFAGILIAQGQLSFTGVWIASVSGGVAGSILLYAIGIWTDNHLVRKFIQRYGHYFKFTEEGLDNALNLFNRYGAMAVFIGRMMPLVRSAVSLTAGMSRMSFRKFALYTTISSMLANSLWISIGYILGENWRDILSVVDELEPLIFPILIIIILSFATYHLLRFTRRQMHRWHTRKNTTVPTAES